MNNLKYLGMILMLWQGSIVAQPLLQVTPDSALYDSPIEIKVTGLEQGQEVELLLKCVDGNNINWQARSTFIADINGVVNPADQAPVTGNYKGVRAMGLFWSMTNTQGAIAFATHRSFAATLSVVFNGDTVARKVIKRTSSRDLKAVGVEEETLNENGCLGKLYYPRIRKGLLQTILLLGGSGGGYQPERASLLACHGFAVLDLPYFSHPGLPEELIRIPVEYIRKATDWLKAHPVTDPTKLGVMGKSKGAELALLAASHFKDFKVVVSDQGSSVAWSGIGSYTKSSWTKDGEEVSFARGSFGQALKWMLNSFGTGNSQLPYMQSAFDKKDRIAQARIPVEQINGPILFISGEDDQLWPSSYMANDMVERLKKERFPFEVLHLSYPNAGHNFGGGTQSFGLPFLPPRDRSNQRFLKGGTVQGNSLAAIDSWPKILAFLKKSL